MRSLATCALVAALAAGGCGGSHHAGGTTSIAVAPTTPDEQLLALLPDHPQVVVEVDLARLRANPVVGALVVRVLADNLVPMPDDPHAGSTLERNDQLLATADHLCLAAYGVGTDAAATITLVDVQHAPAGATPVGDHYYALGPAEWVRQVEARAGLVTANTPLAVSPELLALRARSMPAGAPGATLRITARLSAQARAELAKDIGIANPPAQLSIWGDVVDDLAIVIDAEVTEDRSGKVAKQAVARLTATMQAMLLSAADLPAARALGLTGSLGNAKLAERGRWIRAIIAIGPAHLKRVVERGTAFLGIPSPSPNPSPPSTPVPGATP